MNKEDKKADDLESDPYGEIEFVVNLGSSSHVKHMIDCNLKTPKIGGLKEDFEELFGIPKDQQRWYFGNTLLDDDLTLYKSGIHCSVDVTSPVIKVTRD
ncbi:hypothetical protein BsWGS_19043 [Bradybaena similaris]